MKILGVCRTTLFLFFLSGAAFAESADFQIVSDSGGIVAAPFCDVSLREIVLDPKMNAYIADTWQLPDGSEWTAALEDEQVVTLDCLENGRMKNYVLFDVRTSGAEDQERVGVHASEVTLFNSARRIESAPTLNAKMNVSPLDLPAGVEVAEGPLDYVVCITGQTLNVRDQSLLKVLFTVARHDSAKPVQSFGTDKLKKTVGGVEYTYIKAEFPQAAGRDKTGWVAENYLRTRAQCPGAAVTPAPVPAPRQSAWTFPTIKRPSTSYKEGMRRFKASRSGGRLHAACDLYRVTGEAAVAVSAGTVIRDRYYFYQGTYAIEVKHDGGKVARYGEITGKAAPNVARNKSVNVAQTLGYIGKVNSNCCTPMLHFELYSGSAKGSLSQSGNRFNRRKDLLDPTKLLVDWEKLKFGKSF